MCACMPYVTSRCAYCGYSADYYDIYASPAKHSQVILLCFLYFVHSFTMAYGCISTYGIIRKALANDSALNCVLLM